MEAGFDVVGEPELGQGAGTGVVVLAGFPSAGSGARPANGGGTREPARLLRTPTPLYTELARRNAEHGEVLLLVDLVADGSVRVVQTLAGLRWGLNESAAEAVRDARCQPAIIDGRPTTVRAIVSVTFTLS